ncbi:MAG: MOSC N-terminal beta barrel domain-containing protein, partial [Trebonia sp.]
MTDHEGRDAGRVEALRRYPVKSMLGEDQETLTVRSRGVLGDRAWAVLDRTSGKIASAKRPKLWRDLLTCAARTGTEQVEITLPDGRTRTAGDADLDEALSSLTGRAVRLIDTPPEAAE